MSTEGNKGNEAQRSLIKAVVFDLGKVLVDFDYSIAARRLADRSTVSPEKIRSFIDQSPLLVQLETGMLTTDQFYCEVCAITGFCGTIAEFSDFFADVFVPIEPMIELHAALRRRGLPTYIFSNTNDLAVCHIRRNFPFFANFDGYVLSYECGAMKPEAAIYEVLERKCSRRGTEILYLDDRPENIEAGEARGWKVILQETPEKTLAAVEKLGLLNHQ
jgi:HAD superfamily hydrolase (TIGR01509 family)